MAIAYKVVRSAKWNKNPNSRTISICLIPISCTSDSVTCALIQRAISLGIKDVTGMTEGHISITHLQTTFICTHAATSNKP